MSLEELTYKRQDLLTKPTSDRQRNSFDALVKELTQERLLEYHKFMAFSRENKCISISLSYLTEQGFTLETY